jgi:hypothetical protein
MRSLRVIILNWLQGRNKRKETVMPDIKDVVTNDLVKNALQSTAVVTAVKAQIKADLDSQIDSAVDTALTGLLGAPAGDGSTT